MYKFDTVFVKYLSMFIYCLIILFIILLLLVCINIINILKQKVNKSMLVLYFLDCYNSKLIHICMEIYCNINKNNKVMFEEIISNVFTYIRV